MLSLKRAEARYWEEYLGKMIINIKHEMLVFWAAFLAGQVICIIFDFFRSIRKVSKHSRLSVAVEDVIFCTISFRIFFDIIYLTDNGTVRWYSLAAACLSSVLYFTAESKLVMRIHLAVLSFFEKIISPFVRLILFFKKQIVRLSNALKARISSILCSIRQIHTKKSSKPHENSDII